MRRRPCLMVFGVLESFELCIWAFLGAYGCFSGSQSMVLATNGSLGRYRDVLTGHSWEGLSGRYRFCFL
ncbi:hypothetical protein GQ43DRAFT_3698 [Delitschia confertaspora ATCC 74209]|uniref:Uncharacterized protein n=1 Tax=Delitschia confertaspora ATCC 74209 TaxID=1513339 RepID=A0A9P4K0X2_9PLEO|nr:hypothetical protein GQ43DRAFT_3698 [Delitschia confertaspora ATCC 74209]